jgi:cellulose synthase/poly-beta-1,6-N-acetylglucosamine synthase-like glycosyltransferase
MRDFLLQQERWLGGTYGTVSSFLPKIGLKEIIMFAPWLFILISPATALLLIIAYLLTGNIIYLIGVALGVAVIYAGALPYLEKKEIAMLPATLVFLTIVEGALSLKVVYNRMMKKEIVWHRMPK